MEVRTGVGWQYALADLSLILFMICAAGLARVPPKPQNPAIPALAEPVSVWREGPGAPSLDEWLAAQPADRRQRLTLISQFKQGDAQGAFRRAESALQRVRNATASPRIAVEPGAEDTLVATLTWDSGLARRLQ